MKLILQTTSAEIYEINGEFYVYGATDSGDPIVCPSEAMARSIAAGA